MGAIACKEVLRAVAACAVFGLSGCVVTSGPPRAASAPPAASPPPVASPPPAAPPSTPGAPAAPAATPGPAVEPIPPQPAFASTPEPPEKPTEHAHGIARGRPKDLQPGHPESIFVWHEDNSGQWHLRTTTHSQEHRFSGRVWVSEGSLAEVHPSRVEYNDRIRLSGRSVEFDFHTRGGIDGFDFGAPGARCVHFALFIDGKGDPARVKVGGNSAHPKHHVFTACP